MAKKLSHINAIYLNSQALKNVNYDEGRNILEATFTNERIYQYMNVPEDIWIEFLTVINSGDSAGEFINLRIKPFYSCIEVD